MQMYFRIKNFDRFVGIFVILALALIVVTLVFITRGQKWFEKRYHYSVVFNKVHGLKPGTGVTISGMEVGHVKSLRLNPQSKVELNLEILETFKDNIRKDSQATIVSSFLGAKTIEVTMGSPGQPPLPVGGTLFSEDPRELTDILKEVDVKTPLKKVDDTLENLKSVTAKLNDPRGELFTLLKNVERITTQLKNGQGNVGAILQDTKIHGDIAAAIESIHRSAIHIEETTRKASQIAGDLPKVMAEIERTLKELPVIVNEVKGAAADLPQVTKDVRKATAEAPVLLEKVKDIAEDVKAITGNVKQASPEIPDLLASTHQSLEEAEKLIQGLQKHWLLRGSMPESRSGAPLEIGQRESPYERKRGDSR
jgi:phospholipid/cholesterol/gamma-HCH transport system substrate-binding protein